SFPVPYDERGQRVRDVGHGLLTNVVHLDLLFASGDGRRVRSRTARGVGQPRRSRFRARLRPLRSIASQLRTSSPASQCPMALSDPPPTLFGAARTPRRSRRSRFSRSVSAYAPIQIASISSGLSPPRGPSGRRTPATRAFCSRIIRRSLFRSCPARIVTTWSSGRAAPSPASTAPSPIYSLFVLPRRDRSSP